MKDQVLITPESKQVLASLEKSGTKILKDASELKVYQCENGSIKNLHKNQRGEFEIELKGNESVVLVK